MDCVPKAHGVDFKVWADRLAVIMMLMVLAWCLVGLMMPARAQSDPGARRWWYIPSSRAIRCGGTLRVLRLMVAMLRILWTSWYD
mgnify:FL=1